MMIKRMVRYLRAQDWSAIAIEFVIVAAGVLMGIQVSNWNNDRLEKARVNQQVASLRTELKGNLSTIKTYQRQVESQLADVMAIERAFDQPGTGARIDDRLMNVFRISSMILEMSAYDELTQTGSFRHVDAPTRSAMTEWKSRKGRIERADQDALSYRISAVDYLVGALAFEPMIGSFASAFKPAGNPPIRNAPARLAKDAKVRNFLAMRYAIETQKLQSAKKLERATDNLLSLLARNETD
jgi:hypothetical protein